MHILRLNNERTYMYIPEKLKRLWLLNQNQPNDVFLEFFCVKDCELGRLKIKSQLSRDCRRFILSPSQRFILSLEFTVVFHGLSVLEYNYLILQAN